MATGLTSATISVSANTRQMEKDIAKALKTIELSQIDTKKSSQALGRITGQVSEFNKSLEASNARVIAFGASAGAIFAVEKALSSLITSTIEVEKKLTDINVLLNLSSSSLQKFGGSLFDIAKNTAQSFSSVAEAATELARQGLGVEETLKRTNAALVLARLSGLDTVKSVEALTATLNSFSGSALDAVQVVNKLANVDAAFAVSSADLANAISRVGSTAQDAGVSLDELISIVTAAQQTTARGGAVIGNSLKTIFTRLQRGRVQDLLGSLGVDTSEGQSAVDLLKQLASTYDTLGAKQKSFVAEQVGGVFQINILKAALSDLGKEYSIYDRALVTSLSSTDQAIKRNQQLNQTLSALSSQAVSNLEQAASKIGSLVFEPNAKGFLSSFNGIIESFNSIDTETQGGKFIEGFFKGISNFIGGPGTVLAVAVLTKLFVNLTKFAAGSAKELLGRNESTKQQAALEQSVLSILQKNSVFTEKILSGKMTTVQAEKQLLDYLTAQSNVMREQERISKVIAGNLGRAGVSVGASGVPLTSPAGKKAFSSGFVPNFASDRNVGQAMENAGAREHGYRAGNARKTRIHDGNGKSFSSFVNSKEDVKTFTNAAGKKATIVRPPNGFGENTQYAANGFIPNFKQIPSTFIRGNDFEKDLYQATSIQKPGKNSETLDFPKPKIPKARKKDPLALSSAGVNSSTVYGDAKYGLNSSNITSMISKYLRYKNQKVSGDLQLSDAGFSILYKEGPSDKVISEKRKLSSLVKKNPSLINQIDKSLIDKRSGKLNKKGQSTQVGLSFFADRVLENSGAFSSGYVPNFEKKLLGEGQFAKFYSLNLSNRPDIAGVKKFKQKDNLNKESASYQNIAEEYAISKFLSENTIVKGITAPKVLGSLERSIKARRIGKQVISDPLASASIGESASEDLGWVMEKLLAKKGVGIRDLHGGNYTLNNRGVKFAKKNILDQKDPNYSGVEGYFDKFANGGGLANILDPGMFHTSNPEIKSKIQDLSTVKKTQANNYARGFIPNFASMGSKFKAMYGGGTTMRAVDKEKTAKKKNLDVKKLDLSDRYTMVHGGNQGLDSANVSLEAGNKLFDAKIATAGLDTTGTNLQRYGIKGVVGDALVGATNNIIKTFGGKEQITDASSLDNAGSVGSAAGTVFETALRKSFNAPAVSQTQRIDFPAPTPELRKFFHNAPGQYEAKISKTPDNLKSTLKKWVDVNGLASSASGYIPNFAKTSGLSYSYKDKDEFGFSEIQAIMSGKKVGSFSYAEDKKGQIDVGDFSVNKGERGKGIGAGLYKEAIRRNAGKKMKGQLLPQMNRLLQKIKNGEPVSAETLYPQIKRADLAKSSLFEVYGHKGMQVEKMTRDQFSSFVNAKINELKKDPKKLQSFFGNVEADEYGGLGVDLQTQHASGFVPNFSSALNDAISREQSSGLSKSQIYVDSHSSLKNKNNPMGLMVANRRDEPSGGIQGIKRAKKEGRNPKTYGAASGFIPNFAADASGDGNENTIAALIAGLQGVAFSAIFLRGEMRQFGESIKQGEKSIKDMSEANDKASAEIPSFEKEIQAQAARLDKGNALTEAMSTPEFKAATAKKQAEEKAYKDLEDQVSAGKITIGDPRIEQAKVRLADAQTALGKTYDKEIIRIGQDATEKKKVAEQELQSRKDLISSNKEAAVQQRKSIAEQKKQRLVSIASQAGVAAQVLAPQIASFIPQDTQGGRGAAASVEGLGNIAGMAGTGAMIGGPLGAAAGAAVGALLEIPKIEKAFTSKMPELEKAVTAATESFTKFSDSGQQFLNSSQKLAEIRVNPNSSEGDIIVAEKQYIDALSAMPIKYQEQLVAAERLGNAQKVYSEILEQLSTQKSEVETIRGNREVSERGQENAFQKLGSTFQAIADVAINAPGAALRNASTSFDRMFGIQTEYDNTDYISKALIETFDLIYGRLTSSEDIKSVVAESYNYTKTADDPLTDWNDALSNAQALALNLEGIKSNIQTAGGVEAGNFQKFKSQLLESLTSSYERSGGKITEGELSILNGLKDTISRPDQLQQWLQEYQSTNNQFISGQEKIEEVRKNIAERQKKEAEKRARDRERADQASARISSAKSDVDKLFSDFKYALEEGLSNVKFAGEYESNRGNFAKEMYDLTNMPNASRVQDQSNRIFSIEQTKREATFQEKATGAFSIFESIGDLIDSASLDEKATSGMSDSEIKSANTEFELKKTELKNELIGSGAMNQILQGDTAGAKGTLNALIEKMIASGNFTATQIQDLKNKSIEELDSINDGIKTSNRNELQQKALLAQQLSFERAKERITQAQNIGGGAEDMVSSMLGEEGSLINRTLDAISAAVGGGYNQGQFVQGEDGKFIDKKTGKAPSLDSVGAAAKALDLITQYAGSPVMGMEDTNFKVIAQARNDQVMGEIDKLEKASGGQFGTDIFERIRKKAQDDLGGKNGEIGRLQTLKKFGSIDNNEYISKLTGTYAQEEFSKLPSELQEAIKATTGGDQVLARINVKGFDNVERAIEKSFDAAKISEGIKQGLVAAQVSERKISAEGAIVDATANQAQVKTELEKRKEKLTGKDGLESAFDKAIINAAENSRETGIAGLTVEGASDPLARKKFDELYSEQNKQIAMTQIAARAGDTKNDQLAGVTPKQFLENAASYEQVKGAAEAVKQARLDVSSAQIDMDKATGKLAAAKGLAKSYNSQVDGSGSDQPTAIKGYYTPVKNPKPQAPVNNPINEAMAGFNPMNQTMAGLKPMGQSSAQSNLNTNVGSINVPFSINIQQQAGAPQEAQQAQVQNANQLAESLKNQIQELAQRVASMNAELQKNGSIKPPPPTSPNMK
jgi:TP901 family phage tail tape measure protein